MLSLLSVRQCPASKPGIARGCKGIQWVALQGVANEVENTEEPLVHSSSSQHWSVVKKILVCVGLDTGSTCSKKTMTRLCGDGKSDTVGLVLHHFQCHLFLMESLSVSEVVLMGGQGCGGSDSIARISLPLFVMVTRASSFFSVFGFEFA